MLELVIPETEVFDEVRNEFYIVDKVVLHLEHSLVALSKWESEFQTAFITKEDRTVEQTYAYISHMSLDGPIDRSTLYRLTNDHISQISEYIDRRMTATWLSENEKVRPKGPITAEVITAELIYYWMIALDIPTEFQHWHLQRLLTLIQVTNLKNQPAKKMPRKETMSRQRALNEARRAKYGSSG